MTGTLYLTGPWLLYRTRTLANAPHTSLTLVWHCLKSVPLNYIFPWNSLRCLLVTLSNIFNSTMVLFRVLDKVKYYKNLINMIHVTKISIYLVSIWMTSGKILVKTVCNNNSSCVLKNNVPFTDLIWWRTCRSDWPVNGWYCTDIAIHVQCNPVLLSTWAISSLFWYNVMSSSDILEEWHNPLPHWLEMQHI